MARLIVTSHRDGKSRLDWTNPYPQRRSVGAGVRHRVGVGHRRRSIRPMGWAQRRGWAQERRYPMSEKRG